LICDSPKSPALACACAVIVTGMPSAGAAALLQSELPDLLL
jgi:hypothetical protein